MVIPTTARIRWSQSIRLVPTIYPPIQLFEDVADPADLDAVLALESMTNPRLRQVVGDLQLVPHEERLSGPGTSPIMAAFTHVNADGSRFCDGSYGVYYAARDLPTAIAETRFHRARFLRATNEASTEITLRAYAAAIRASFHDIRGQKNTLSDIYDARPERYGAGQSLAKALRDNSSNGIVYDSVRHAAGQCVAVFRPRCITPPARETCKLRYVWNGEKQDITDVFELTPLEVTPG